MARKSVKKSTLVEEPTAPAADDAPQSVEAGGNDGSKEERTRHTVYKGLPKGSGKSSSHRAPTVSDIIVDPITQLASEHWNGNVKGTYHPQMVSDIYQSEILRGNPARFQLLDVSGYLEGYLWPHFGASVAVDHVFSIILIVNEKYKNGLTALDELSKDETKFKVLFESIVDLVLNATPLNDPQREQYYQFLINCFRGIENAAMRQSALRYLSMPMWESLSKTRLALELGENERLAEHWAAYAAHKEDLERRAKPAASSSTPSKADGGSAKKDKSAGKRKRKDDVEEGVALSAEEVAQLEEMRRDSAWFPSLLSAFADDLCTESATPLDATKVLAMERFAELIIDLLSQLPTRRFLRVLLDDMHFLLLCRRSPRLAQLGSDLFDKLVKNIEHYLHFEVDDHTGKALTPQDMLERNNAKIHRLQQLAYAYFPEVLKDLVFCSVGELSKKAQLLRHLQLLDQPQLVQLGKLLGVITDRDLALSALGTDSPRNAVVDLQSEEVLWELLTEYLVPRASHIDDLNMMPLYPTETLLWDADKLPLNSNHFGNEVLALPKLNLQFLSIHDYLLRNFTLFRLESAYEIRDDLMDAIKRVGPKTGLRGAVTFSGWARMALPIESVSIDEVTKPRLGDTLPRKVDCTVTIDVARFNGDMRSEWEGFREHDVVFLVCIENPLPDALARLSEYESKQRSRFASRPKAGSVLGEDEANTEDEEELFDFARTFGVKYVRGGELFEFRDEANVVLNDPTRPDERKGGAVGTKRKLRLHLDPAQYYLDMRDGVDCYEQLNLVVRRNPKENNFKAILATIRELINTAAVGRAIPNWLHDVFLGYGNPGAANYKALTKGTEDSIDYGDTFLDAQHVIESFPNSKVVFTADNTDGLPPPPYRITVTRGASEATEEATSTSKKDGKKRSKATAAASTSETEVVTAHPYARSSRGPYPEDAVLLNSVRFTPTQIEAIRSGTNPGLTMVVGPPGTGKTDVAVQIIVNLYRNHPTQKILIVTHSNAALNDLFEKIMERDVAPRHLLRLGSGEQELRDTLAVGGAGGGGKGQGEVFSKQGRVNWSLARRLQLLAQVQKLSVSIGVPGDMGNTCETAAYFQLEHVQARIEKFNLSIASASHRPATVEEVFPFKQYFADAPAALFTGDWDTDLESARGCFTHINKIFEELADYRAFELLRSQTLRSDFLLTKQARIVAMTCTHAAMTRGRLVELGFKYDSIVMEEAAQVLEVETLIPMLLQDTDPVDGCRLKRVVLIGDHHQLPPVVKHLAFQKFSKLDQSLFTRFVRLGVPAVMLDKQGRARAEIAALYSWRYQLASCQLGNLPNVLEKPQYLTANAGFAYTFQFIDVPAFQGKGESCPTPHFYQNLGEAEYVVAMYQYMRLLGYPAERIALLTTYNGQKQLIADIVAQRCKNDMFGLPGAISTVDKYQGQQSDYVLLSLVRTEAVGHIRDVRRLVVALSRARLGLYVFGRLSLFENCYELTPAFSLLRARPHVLELVAGEGYGATERKADEAPAEGLRSAVADVTAMGVLVYQMAQQAQGLAQAAMAVESTAT